MGADDAVRGGGRHQRLLVEHGIRHERRRFEDAEVTPQEVVLSDLLRRKLEKFCSWKERDRESVAPSAPLFVSRRGTRLSALQLRRLVHLWQARAGTSVGPNWHALRHTSCTNLYRATKDIRLTQRFARHKSLRSTLRYTHPRDEDLVLAVEDLLC